jgi:N-acetyl-anhydromuramyl-L-alanine amidase AmpD
MEQWYAPAVQRPGPPSKVGYDHADTNQVAGVVCHDSVGPLAPTLGELDKLTRRASWAFTVDVDGTVYQHYPLSAVTWHCGSLAFNVSLVGIEHTRRSQADGSPIEGAQLAASVDLVKWIATQGGFPVDRPAHLHEHNEVAPADDPTSCPSGRIPWKEYSMVTPDTGTVTAGEFRAFFALEQLRYSLFLETARAVADLARHVYGEDDARIAALEAKVKLGDTLLGKPPIKNAGDGG